MTVRGNRFIMAVTRFTALKLVDILADQIGFDAVTGDKREGFLEDFKFAQTRKLIEHEQQSVLVVQNRLAIAKYHLTSELANNHVDQNADQRPQA